MSVDDTAVRSDDIDDEIDGVLELAFAVEVRQVGCGEGDLWQSGCFERVPAFGDSVGVIGAECRSGGDFAEQCSDQGGQDSAK